MRPLADRHSALLAAGRITGRVAASAVAGMSVLVALGMSLAMALVMAVAPSAAADDAPSGWASSTWTGVVAGAPVPGTGLPPAAVPVAPVALPATYDVAATYEGQAQCDTTTKPGAQRLADLIRATYGAEQVIGILRNCSIGGQSEHKEGRAVDWMVSVRKAQERANAEAFLNWLLGPDQYGTPYGNAIRMGVMYIGWNDRIWRGYDVAKGWAELKGCFARSAPASDNDCHRNHVHISLTWDGAAGTTSMWDGTPQDVPYCPRVSSAATPVVGQVRGALVGVDPVRVLDTRAAIGVASRCRLLQGTWSRTLTRMLVPVLGQGGVPASGVEAVRVRVSALGSNAPATVRIWTPGQDAPTPVTGVGMGADAAGEISLPVSTSGTIALATTAGATDLVVEVLGYYPAGSAGDAVAMQATPATPTQSVGAVAVPPPSPPATPSSPAAPPATPDPAAPAPSAPNPSAPNPEGAPDFSGEQLSMTAPAQPAGPFVAVGSIVGYESTAQGPLQPGEARTVPLAGVPGDATSAVLFVTAKDGSKAGVVRMGQPGRMATRLAFPKKHMSKAVVVAPVSGGSIMLKGKKASVSVRIEVLAYGSAATEQAYVALPAAKAFSGSLQPGQARTVQVTGAFGLPKKAKRVTAVVLRVQTRKAAQDGTVAVYASGGAAPETRSAPVLAGKQYAAMVLAPVGADGRISFTSNVGATVRATVVGYVR